MRQVSPPLFNLEYLSPLMSTNENFNGTNRHKRSTNRSQKIGQFGDGGGGANLTEVTVRGPSAEVSLLFLFHEICVSAA